MSNKVQKEGKVVLAIGAIKSSQIQSIRGAARLYTAPRSTVQDRLNGRVARVDTRANSHKLTPTEEETLRAWLIDMDDRGYPLTLSHLRSAANLLLQARAEPDAAVGKNWPTRYIHRQPDLKSRYNRKYDHQRALCEDPTLIASWFRLVANTIAKYGIQSDDIYNFDETGFALGIASTSRVVTRSDRRGRPHLIQQGDREWATVIEAIGAGGYLLPPMVILKGKVHM
jgi:hypothetical protein